MKRINWKGRYQRLLKRYQKLKKEKFEGDVYKHRYLEVRSAFRDY